MHPDCPYTHDPLHLAETDTAAVLAADITLGPAMREYDRCAICLHPIDWGETVGHATVYAQIPVLYCWRCTLAVLEAQGLIPPDLNAIPAQFGSGLQPPFTWPPRPAPKPRNTALPGPRYVGKGCKRP